MTVTVTVAITATTATTVVTVVTVVTATNSSDSRDTCSHSEPALQRLPAKLFRPKRGRCASLTLKRAAKWPPFRLPKLPKADVNFVRRSPSFVRPNPPRHQARRPCSSIPSEYLSKCKDTMGRARYNPMKQRKKFVQRNLKSIRNLSNIKVVVSTWDDRVLILMTTSTHNTTYLKEAVFS